jgi:large subunit ribosomal protein L10
MSKFVKKLEADAVAATLGDGRDYLLLNLTGMKAQDENAMRLALRKKKIRLHHVKNSLVRRLFDSKGFKGVETFLTGPTVVAWGMSEDVAIATVSKEIDVFAAKNKSIKPKTAIADGAAIPFEDAKRMPTHAEAIGMLLAQIMGPARTLAGQLKGAGAKLAGQLKALEDKLGKEAPAPAPEPAVAAEPAAIAEPAAAAPTAG